jgi:D-3-phosphoglycerate dehydrogenase
MKPDAIIINTSRRGIINEHDLYEVMLSGHLSGVAMDVFEIEPYEGPLKEIERCLLTAHMGSMSVDCRSRMEIESTEEAIRFFIGKALESEVPQEEYDVQSQGL